MSGAVDHGGATDTEPRRAGDASGDGIGAVRVPGAHGVALPQLRDDDQLCVVCAREFAGQHLCSTDGGDVGGVGGDDGLGGGVYRHHGSAGASVVVDDASEVLCGSAAGARGPRLGMENLHSCAWNRWLEVMDRHTQPLL